LAESVPTSDAKQAVQQCANWNAAPVKVCFRQCLRDHASQGDKQMKVLIAYDGSNCAQAALADLWRAGLPTTAEVLLMLVEEIVPALPSPGALTVSDPATPLPDTTSDRNELLSAARLRLQQDFPHWQLHTVHETGSPATRLLAQAETWQPDLLVAGSHGRTALGRLVLGSVSQTLAVEAPCSVRVARGRVLEAARPIRLVIGVDGSAGAEAAVRAVAARVWPAGSEARVVVAVNDTLSEVMNYVDETSQQGWAWLQETVAAAEKTLLAAGLSATPHIQQGAPAELLVQEAETWEADCIFVGAQSFRTEDRLRLGSVAAAVAARANCSVEVVR